ncbi:MAG: hypothetical protein OXT06_09215 [Rhodospirillaceae bacterium]|nr:hypothetical protein [Rhodospirillaceae bacterium]
MRATRSKKHPLVYQIQMERMKKGATYDEVRDAEKALYKMTVAELKDVLKEERAAPTENLMNKSATINPNHY